MRAADLEPAERHLVARRRLGQSQADRARGLGVSLWTYRTWEAGAEFPARIPTLGTLEAHEVYFVRRRRAGLSRGQLARRLGLSEYYVTQMERGRAPVARLAAYWGPVA